MLYIQREKHTGAKAHLSCFLQVTRTQWLLCHCAQLELKEKTWKCFALALLIFLRRCCMQFCFFFVFFFFFFAVKQLEIYTKYMATLTGSTRRGTHTHTGTVCVGCALIWMYYNKFRRYKIPAQKDTKHRCLHELFRASPVKWNQGRHKARNRGGSRQPEPGHKCCGRTIETVGRGERGAKWGSRLWLDTVSVLHGGYVCNVWLNL